MKKATQGRKARQEISDAEEAAVRRMIAADPDDAEATDEQIAQAKPFGEALPDLMEGIRRARGRPRVADPKQAVSLRVSSKTLARFQAKGENWRALMARVLDRAKL